MPVALSVYQSNTTDLPGAINLKARPFARNAKMIYAPSDMNAAYSRITRSLARPFTRTTLFDGSKIIRVIAINRISHRDSASELTEALHALYARFRD